jgi:hypothetical protein
MCERRSTSSSALRAPSPPKEEKGLSDAQFLLESACLHATLSSSGGEGRGEEVNQIQFQVMRVNLMHFYQSGYVKLISQHDRNSGE